MSRIRTNNPNEMRSSPDGVRMARPTQGLNIQGSGGKPSAPPVGHIVELASGRAAVDTKSIKTQTKRASY